MQRLHDAVSKLPILAHIVATAVAFAAFRLVNVILDASYARSLFPVPYYEGQTAFQGPVIKSYYQVMIDADTLPIYWKTQLIDFGFITALFIYGVLLPLLVRRLYQPTKLPYRLATAAAWLIPIGALFDVLENLTSFSMLLQPQTFPDWIAPVYSSFAVLKFAAIGLGFACILLSLLIGLGQWIITRFKAKT